MILTGVIGLCLVAVAWILLYLYFIHRTDKFMDNWKKEIKEKAEKATYASIRSIEQAARSLEVSVAAIQSLQEAVEAIKTSRILMEKFALERGCKIEKSKEAITAATPMNEAQLESIPSPLPTNQFVYYERHKRKDWENFNSSAVQPAFSLNY